MSGLIAGGDGYPGPSAEFKPDFRFEDDIAITAVATEPVNPENIHKSIDSLFPMLTRKEPTTFFAKLISHLARNIHY